MKRYTFTDEEMEEIKAAREMNRDNHVEKRLATLQMRAEGKRNKEISEKTGFHTQYITVPVSRYKAKGLGRITENHYHGNRRNLGYTMQRSRNICPQKKLQLNKNFRVCKSDLLLYFVAGLLCCVLFFAVSCYS